MYKVRSMIRKVAEGLDPRVVLTGIVEAKYYRMGDKKYDMLGITKAIENDTKYIVTKARGKAFGKSFPELRFIDPDTKKSVGSIAFWKGPHGDGSEAQNYAPQELERVVDRILQRYSSSD